MTSSPMPAEKFWGIIENAAESDHDQDAQVEALRRLLRELTLEDIISFHVAFRHYLNRACTWELWGAAELINGGCSDDGFEYFRCWLVSKGRYVYEAALADPDSLAQLDAQPGPGGDWEFGDINVVACRVFEEKTGYDIYRYAQPEVAGVPGDEPFEDDDGHLARRYPKLWQRFSAEPLD